MMDEFALVSTLVGWAKVLRLPVMKSSEERASPLASGSGCFRREWYRSFRVGTSPW